MTVNKNTRKEIDWLLKEKYNGKPTARQLAAFKKDVKRVDNGEPIDYVIGFVEFLGCRIDLLKHPLIPRKETEFWVAIALDKIKNKIAALRSRTWQPGLPEQKFEKIKCLDIFAGSGCVGIAILANENDVLCDFAEKDKKALAQIKINLKNNFIKPDRYKVISSDVFKKVKGKYDFIFANPPYIPTVKKNRIQKSVLGYEPKIALFGGKDGMSFIKKFLKDAKKYLNNEGIIFMEIDSSVSQKKEIEKLLKKYKYKNWEFKKDQYGKTRWVEVRN